MKVCARCGTQSEDTATECGACGHALARARDFKKTMLGFAAPASAQAGQASQSPAPAFGRTMLGGVGSGPAAAGPTPGPSPPDDSKTPRAPAPPPPGDSAHSLKKTMLGFAAPATAPGQPSAASAAPSVAAGSAQSSDPLRGTLVVDPPGAPGGSTLLGGVAPPGLAGSQTLGGFAPPTTGGGTVAGGFAPAAGGPAPTPTLAAGSSPAPHRDAPPPPAGKRTMLGVARPGIAPLNPGVAKPSSTPPPAPAFDPYSAVGPPPAAPQAAEPGPAPVVRTSLPKGAFVLLAVALVLVAIAVAIALLWQGPKPIEAKAALDEKGNEQLELSCADCPDGTRVHLGENVAIIEGSKARLPLPSPLRVGNNTLHVAVERPGIGRDENVELEVPVEYRVRGDLTGLEEDPPRLLVRVEAAPGSEVVVGGQAVTLDASGHGQHAVEVTDDLSGTAGTLEYLERKLPYSVRAPGATAQTGQIDLKLPIAPLRIDAPGQRIVIDGENFMLTGRTVKEGKITVAGRPITVDPEGRFSQLMSVSSVGETTITVAAKGAELAPRFADIQVKRVANLRDEAKRFAENATTELSAVRQGMNGKAMPRVALSGQVVESRVDNHTTLVLLDVIDDCEEDSCLVRLVYGAKRQLEKGDALQAFGTLTGSVEGPRSGTRLPEIAVEFLLEKAR